MTIRRRTRKNFRKEVLLLIRAGEGNFENLMSLAREFFGSEVGYEDVIQAFLQTMVSQSVAQLRNEGHIETIGKKWKPVEELESVDVAVISHRRLRRLDGELKAQIVLAHQHGRVEEAVRLSETRSLVLFQLAECETELEEANEKVEA